MKRKRHRILVFQIGQLGDTLVSVPSLHVIRNSFPDSQITLLFDEHIDKKYILASDILKKAKLIDDFLSYPVSTTFKGKLVKAAKTLKLITELRLRRYDSMVYLVPSLRNPDQVKRDILFFRLCGITDFLGTESFYPLKLERVDGALLPVTHEVDMLLSRLSRSGMHIPESKCFDINLGDDEKSAVEKWFSTQPCPGDRPMIGVGTTTNRPVTAWPVENYSDVVAKLIDRYDVVPIIFGGKKDQELAEYLSKKWSRGLIAAGKLNVRQAIYALGQCKLFLGNDTGSMHMAVASGIRCIGVYSSRHPPGLWYPYGEGHIVHRTPIECSGCRLNVCTENKMKCITSITVDEVYESCAKILDNN